MPQLFVPSYYLSPRGSDAASGQTPSNAWRSLARASRHEYEAGDKILLQAGECFEGSLELGGEAIGAYVFVGSFGEGRALVVSEGTDAVRIRNRPFDIENLVVRGNWNWKSQSGNDGHGIFVLADVGSRGLEARIANCEAQGFKWAGIECRGGSRDGSKQGFSRIRIADCVAHENGAAGILVGGVMMRLSMEYCHRDVEIRGCRAHHNRGITKRGSHSGSGIVASDFEGGLIADCVAFENGELNDFPGGGPVGIWLWDCKRGAISGCESHHNRTMTKDGGGFDLDGGCVDCEIERCHSHDNGGCGFLVCQFTDARAFHGNRVRDCRSEYDTGGIVLWTGSSSLIGTEVCGNTIVSEPGHGNEIPAPLRLLTATRNTYIHDNSFICEGVLPLFEIAEDQPGLRIENNKFLNRNAPPEFLWQGRVYNEFERLRSDSGLELGMVESG